MKHKVRLTVIDKKLYPELQNKYCMDKNSGPWSHKPLTTSISFLACSIGLDRLTSSSFSFTRRRFEIRRSLSLRRMCDLMMSHINSTKRPSVNGSPYDFMALAYGTEILDLMKIKKIDSNMVILLPRLLTNI